MPYSLRLPVRPGGNPRANRWFLSQVPYKCHLEEVASMGDSLKICPQLDSRVNYSIGLGAAWRPCLYRSVSLNRCILVLKEVSLYRCVSINAPKTSPLSLSLSRWTLSLSLFLSLCLSLSVSVSLTLYISPTHTLVQPSHFIPKPRRGEIRRRLLWATFLPSTHCYTTFRKVGRCRE